VDVLPVTPELVGRLEGAIDAFGIARLEALAAMPENPLELRIERFGDAVAPASVAEPELDFVNRITRLTPRDAGRLDDILGFYRGLGLRPWLEVTPGVEVKLSAETELLAFQTVLCSPLRADGDPIVEVREATEATAAARLILQAFGVPADRVERHGDELARASETCGGRIFVLEAEGRPAAGAILTTFDGVGYLAMAGTLPEFRGRGFQRALIAARIAAAAEAGCELIVATAEFGSVSQRNIERGGLRTAYTKPVLRLTPPGEPTPGATA
jgi:GNAT superfamily N-acetyltransferase